MLKKIIFIVLAVCLMTVDAKAQYGEFVGGDISLLPLYEQHNSGYLDRKGNRINDLVKWFVEECGWNSFRVRLFVEPKQRNGRGEYDPSVCQNLEYVQQLGRRIKDAGASLVLDLHYSDSWADPTYQLIPAAWSDCLTPAQKADCVYSYTRETLQAMIAAGAAPDFVQVGNEISYGMLGVKVYPYDDTPSDWAGFAAILSQGVKAVREICPQAKVIIHTERSGKANETVYIYNKLETIGVDYDIIGLSYYPFYHGSLSQLDATLTVLQNAVPDKKVQIMETSYPFQTYPVDAVYDLSSEWQATAQGQYDYAAALLACLATHANVNALYWWQPEEAGNGDDSDWSVGGKGASVMTAWLTRGFWWCDKKTTGHWPVTTSAGMVPKLMSSFLAPVTAASSIVSSTSVATDSEWYNLSGQAISRPINPGIYIHNKKVIRK